MTRIIAGDPGSENVQVYIDGKLVEWCFEADDVDGYAIVYDGVWRPLPFANIPTKRVEGVVEFRPGTFD